MHYWYKSKFQKQLNYFGLSGFSEIEIILLSESKSNTPNCFGFLTYAQNS